LFAAVNLCDIFVAILLCYWQPSWWNWWVLGGRCLFTERCMYEYFDQYPV